MEKGSGQFLLLDDALRVKGRDAQNAYANIQGMGNQKSVLDQCVPKKNILKNYKEIFSVIVLRFPKTKSPKSVDATKKQPSF